MTLLRACYFQDNVAGAIPVASHAGIYPNFLASADTPIPMIATRDIGRFAAQALLAPPREREIVEFVCRGMKNKEIADALSITPGTVKVHLMHIFEKTGVKDRFQLALQGRQFLASAEESGFRRAAGA